jgi:hypothetical protein
MMVVWPVEEGKERMKDAGWWGIYGIGVRKVNVNANAKEEVALIFGHGQRGRSKNE